MNTSTKILIGVGAAAGIGAWYYSAAQGLVFDITNPATGLPNIQVMGADATGLHLNLRFAVTNPSILPFVSPTFDFVFDTAAGQLGTAHNTTLQHIPGRSTSFVDVDAIIPYAGAASQAISIIQSQQLPTGITYTGTINLPLFRVPISGQLT
jgi:hypothetical protein